jgi:hypothetical protein
MNAFSSIQSVIAYIAEYGDRVTTAPSGETIYDGISYHAPATWAMQSTLQRTATSS